ncbi:MAG: hypothetical protein IIC13_05600, partial [SAR324 cluster bacterium]|nr:hypothetical protein [SAR324 cluster bacterium]
ADDSSGDGDLFSSPVSAFSSFVNGEVWRAGSTLGDRQSIFPHDPSVVVVYEIRGLKKPEGNFQSDPAGGVEINGDAGGGYQPWRSMEDKTEVIVLISINTISCK